MTGFTLPSILVSLTFGATSHPATKVAFLVSFGGFLGFEVLTSLLVLVISATVPPNCSSVDVGLVAEREVDVRQGGLVARDGEPPVRSRAAQAESVRGQHLSVIERPVRVPVEHEAHRTAVGDVEPAVDR